MILRSAAVIGTFLALAATPSRAQGPLSWQPAPDQSMSLAPSRVISLAAGYLGLSDSAGLTTQPVLVSDEHPFGADYEGAMWLVEARDVEIPIVAPLPRTTVVTLNVLLDDLDGHLLAACTAAKPLEQWVAPFFEVSRDSLIEVLHHQLRSMEWTCSEIDDQDLSATVLDVFDAMQRKAGVGIEAPGQIILRPRIVSVGNRVPRVDENGKIREVWPPFHAVLGWVAETRGSVTHYGQGSALSYRSNGAPSDSSYYTGSLWLFEDATLEYIRGTVTW